MALNLGELNVLMTADTLMFDQNMNTSMKKLDTFATKATKMAKVATGAFAGIALAVTGVTKTAGNFDKAMAQSLAIMDNVSQKTRKEMEKTALDVSGAVSYGAKEAAGAYYYLASAGLDAAQSIKALPKVTKFGEAGQFDLAAATDYLTDAQSALGLAVKDSTENMKNMARVSDVLVKANTLANASVRQFSEALTNKAAASLRNVNKKVEEGVAVLATLADQGTKGSKAGEWLSMVMRDLQRVGITSEDALNKYNIEIYDAEGNMKNMADIIEDLENALMGMSDKQIKATLAELGFQERSVEVTKTLIGTSSAIRKYERELKNAAGTTEKVAEDQLDNIIDQLGLTKDKFIAGAIALGDKFIPYVQTANSYLDDLAEKFSSLTDEQTTNIAKWTVMTGGILAAIIAFGLFAKATTTVVAGIKLVGTILGIFTSPAILTGLAVAGIATLIYTAWDQDWGGIQTAVTNFVDNVTKKFDVLKSWWETTDLAKIINEAWADIVDIWTSEDLTLPEKVLETVNVVVKSVGKLIESLNEWWTGQAIELVEKGAKLLGLSPDDLWIYNFLVDLNKVWGDADLTFGEKTVESIKLIPGGTWVVDFGEKLKEIWKNSELTLPEKTVESLELIPGVTFVKDNILDWIDEHGDEVTTAWTWGVFGLTWVKDNILDWWNEHGEEVSTAWTWGVFGLSWVKDNIIDWWEKHEKGIKTVWTFTIEGLESVKKFLKDNSSFQWPLVQSGNSPNDKIWNFFKGNYATGGKISGPGTGTSDSILARISNGEFVVNAGATKHWLPFLEAINGGALPGFKYGTSSRKLPVTGTAFDGSLVDTSKWLGNISDGLSETFQLVRTKAVEFFKWLGDLLTGLIKRLFPEQYEKIADFINEMKIRFEGFTKTVEDVIKPGEPSEPEPKEPIYKTPTLLDQICDKFTKLNGILEENNENVAELIDIISEFNYDAARKINKFQSLLNAIADIPDTAKKIDAGFASIRNEVSEIFGGGPIGDTMGALAGGYTGWQSFSQGSTGTNWIGGISGLLAGLGIGGPIMAAVAAASQLVNAIAPGTPKNQSDQELQKQINKYNKMLKEWGASYRSDNLSFKKDSGFLGWRNWFGNVKWSTKNKEAAEAGAEIAEQIISSMQNIFANLSGDLWKVIFEGANFEDFSALVGKQLQQALFSAILEAEAIKGPMQKLSAYMAEATMDGILSDEEIAKIKALAGTVYDAAQPFAELAEEIADEFGIAHEEVKGIAGQMRNMPSGFKINLERFKAAEGLASGGFVNGPGTGTSDSILARISNGEFIVNANATRKWLPLLEKINSGNIKGYSSGGYVGPISTKANIESSKIEIHNHFEGSNIYNMNDFEKQVNKITSKAIRKERLSNRGLQMG